MCCESKVALHCTPVCRKFFLMISLITNLAIYVLLIQYTRKHDVNGSIYIASTVVLIAEILKVIFSSAVIVWKHKSTSKSFIYVIYVHCLRRPSQLGKTLLICSLYALQNNMIFIAVENMNSAVYQVTSQLKIVSTALMSRIILHRKMTPKRWSAIILLFVGVSLVQLEQFQTYNQDDVKPDIRQKSLTIGLLATLTISMLSGIAGVSYEKLIKSDETEFWVCNFHMHLSGFIASATVCILKDYNSIIENGYFFSYTPAVFLVTVVMASGGILVSLVVCYLDSVTKTFLIGGAVILSAICSVYLHDTTLGAKFMAGTLLVSMAAYMYN